MALDELTLLVNRLRRLEENNEDNKNDNKIDEIREKIAKLLSNSDKKVIIKCSYDREVCMKDFDKEDYDWIIDELVNTHSTQEGVLVKDIVYNLDNYVTWDDVLVTIEDENGNEFESFC